MMSDPLYLSGARRRAHASPPAATNEFVTDWQLYDNLVPRPRIPFDGGEDPDAGGKFDGDSYFRDADFNGREDEEQSEEDDGFIPDQRRNTGDDFDALYLDIGGEG